MPFLIFQTPLPATRAPLLFVSVNEVWERGFAKRQNRLAVLLSEVWASVQAVEEGNARLRRSRLRSVGQGLPHPTDTRQTATDSPASATSETTMRM